MAIPVVLRGITRFPSCVALRERQNSPRRLGGFCPLRLCPLESQYVDRNDYTVHYDIDVARRTCIG